MKLTPNSYDEILKKHTPKSPIIKDICFAFVIGGLICVIGQLIMNFYKDLGFDKLQSGTATSITLIFIGALLTGLKLYDKLAKHAGAGTIVPITGFANSIVAAALEFKSEGYILGLATKMFVIAGPVLVYGISTSIIYGIIAFALGLY